MNSAIAIAPFLGVEIVKSIAEALYKVREVREIASALEKAAGRDAETDADETVIKATMALAELINANGMSMVVVIDDAHDADATTLAAVERLLESPRAVLVIATSRPTALKRQRVNGEGFGLRLERAARTHRIENRELELLSPGELAGLAEAAVRERQPNAMDPAAAQLLADRAAGNPLLLAHLLELASANGLTLEERYLPDLEELPSEPEVDLAKCGRASCPTMYAERCRWLRCWAPLSMTKS